MRTCNYGPCEHEDEYKALGKVASALGKKNHALGTENEQLRGKLEESRRALNDANHRAMDAYRELLVLRTQYEALSAKAFAYVALYGLLPSDREDVPPSTDRPDLRAKFLGAFDNVIGPKPRFDPVNYGVVVGVAREGGPCTAHDAFSTACLEDGDQYLP